MNQQSNASTASRYEPALPELDSTLALLAAVQPRAGLEQRVLARLAALPAQPLLPWYRRFATSPWVNATALAAASTVVVAGVAFIGMHQSQPAPVTSPAIAAHAPHSTQQPVSTAAGVAVPEHTLQHGTTHLRHRGIHRGYRAEHERISALPSGSVAPMRPVPRSAQH